MTEVAQLGGVFALLALMHFVADWSPQTHACAMQKHERADLRAVHCVEYAALMWMAASAYGLPADSAPFWFVPAWLFVTHFVEDTYAPVYLWARYVRRVPIVRERGRAGFAEWVQTPLGLVLLISIDQIIHLVCLLPVAVAIVRYAT